MESIDFDVLNTALTWHEQGHRVLLGTVTHTCIGNILARQEIRVTLEELLARTKAVRLREPATHEFWHPFGATRLMLALEPNAI